MLWWLSEMESGYAGEAELHDNQSMLRWLNHPKTLFGIDRLAADAVLFELGT
jgi:hypothetical protein